jgi:hypothetical protein
MCLDFNKVMCYYFIWVKFLNCSFSNINISSPVEKYSYHIVSKHRRLEY